MLTATGDVDEAVVADIERHAYVRDVMGPHQGAWPCSSVLWNLQNATAISVAGIALIERMALAMRRRKGKLILVKPPRSVTEVLRATGELGSVVVFHTQTEALRYLNRLVRQSLGQVLLGLGLVERSSLEWALLSQRTGFPWRRLGKVLLHQGLLTRARLATALRVQRELRTA